MAFEILPTKLNPKRPEFVEANPYGNELKPTNKVPVSYKNQTAADEIPDKQSKSSRPFVKGENKKYKKIVSGTSDNLDKLDPSRIIRVLERPLTEHTRQQQKKTTSNKVTLQQTQKTTTQVEKSQTKQQINNIKILQTKKSSKEHSKDTESKELNQTSKNVVRVDKIDAIRSESSSNSIIIPKVEENKKSTTTKQSSKISVKTTSSKNIIKDKQLHLEEKPLASQTSVMPATADIPKPKARPRLSMKIPAGPLMNNNAAASRAGVVSIDSKFSEFGAYQQRMIEAISRQWNLLGSKYDLSSEYGSFVVIEFSLNTEGELVNFRIVTTTSTNIGKGLCEQSILSTAPYGVWTQEMVNTLGQQPQQVRIQFNYR
ncbi:MAG: hypothetical protein J6B07_01465 [Opitutales bacterium]|nr:hypothetical protein [Opitutales bacterium]